MQTKKAEIKQAFPIINQVLQTLSRTVPPKLYQKTYTLPNQSLFTEHRPSLNLVNCPIIVAL